MEVQNPFKCEERITTLVAMYEASRREYGIQSFTGSSKRHFMRSKGDDIMAKRFDSALRSNPEGAR
jgi:hypothetical protein